jgi:uncharacterized protein (TIGR02147 family)
MEESDRVEVRVEAYRRIQKMFRYRSLHKKEVEVFQYLSSWLNVTLRELSFSRDFVDVPKWIRPRLSFPASSAKIRSSLSFLKKSGFIEKNGAGKWRPSEKEIVCQDAAFRVALSAFHTEMLALSQEAVRRLQEKDRYFQGYFLSVNRADFSKVTEVLDQSIDKISALDQGPGGEADSVIQVWVGSILAANTSTT